MKKGFLYYCAIIDVYCRLIVGWNISNSLEASWCVNVLEDAVATYGNPAIINSDQGAHGVARRFTSQDWVEKVKELNIKISMDGKGRALDNRWIERFWRTLKYDHVYLHPAEDGSQLFQECNRFISYYNHEKLHHTTAEISAVRFRSTTQKQKGNEQISLT